jgi:hypothetical protein
MNDTEERSRVLMYDIYTEVLKKAAKNLSHDDVMS